jgi:sugar phosphate isomerase/epimerase
LLYHNHDFEYKYDENGIVPIEYFMEKGYKIWHVKDMDDQGRFAPVGTGTIDFARLFEKKEVSGMEYCIVEQDRTFDDMDPLEAIKISKEGIKKFGIK